MKIWPGWRLRGLLVTCWTTSVRFMFPWTCRLTPTACLTPLMLDACTLQHKAHCCDSELQKYNWLSRKKHICFCPKGNHSEHKRNLITGQRCPEFLLALPTELHVRSRSLSCQLSHAKSVWSLMQTVRLKVWSFVCCFLHARSCSILASPDPSPDACSERHHKAYRHFSTVNDETKNVEASDRGTHFLYTYFCYSELRSFKIHWSKTVIRLSPALQTIVFLIWVSRRASALHSESSLWKTFRFKQLPANIQTFCSCWEKFK